MNKLYATDVTDEQWALIEPLLPPAKHVVAPPTPNLRLVFNTILYLNKTGCQWYMLPNDLAKRRGQARPGLRHQLGVGPARIQSSVGVGQVAISGLAPDFLRRAADVGRFAITCTSPNAHHNIGRFQVAVDHSLGVGIRKRLNHLRGVTQ